MTYKRPLPKFKKRLALLRDRSIFTTECSEATRTFGVTAQTINSGSCFDWAVIMFNAIPGCKIAGQNIRGCGHTWVEYRGRLYDAEVPNGVRNWKDLPFWVRLKAEAGTKDWNKALKEAGL